MAFRRSAGSLLPRLLQSQAGQQQALSGAFSQALSGAFSQAQTQALSEALPSASSIFSNVAFRGFATAEITPTVTGLPPTVHALKNPSPVIQYDQHSHEKFAHGDPSKRAFTYFVLTSGRFIYASAIRLAVLKFILSMTASKDVLAMASLEVDLSKISMGQTVTVKWRGKPVFIRRRSEEDVAHANDVNLSELRDPEPDSDRVRGSPEWLVLVGVCTHLGCVPLANAGDWGGWFCPCHGSHYDMSGRARKGPAPYNLEVPEYKFAEENLLVVG